MDDAYSEHTEPAALEAKRSETTGVLCWRGYTGSSAGGPSQT